MNLASQIGLAALYLVGALSEDGEPFHWPSVQQHFWQLFVGGQVLAVLGGFWEGRTGRDGWRRLLVSGAGSLMLVAAALLSAGSRPIHALLVVPPAALQAACIFAPSWIALLVGRAFQRRSHDGVGWRFS